MEELLELTADLVWLWPEELRELTDRGASRVLEIFLLETFADDLWVLPVFCLTEGFCTALLFITSADLRGVLVSLTALELPANLVDAFFSTLREISVVFRAELFSLFLLVLTVADLREFSVPWFTEEPEAVLLATLVAEDLCTPERLFSIDLLWAALGSFTLRPLTEELSRVLALRSEFVLA